MKFVALSRKWWSKPSQEKEFKKANWLSEEEYKQLRKEEKQKAKEKRQYTLICMQGSKEKQGEIRKPSSAINAKE